MCSLLFCKEQTCFLWNENHWMTDVFTGKRKLIDEDEDGNAKEKVKEGVLAVGCFSFYFFCLNVCWRNNGFYSDFFFFVLHVLKIRLSHIVIIVRRRETSIKREKKQPRTWEQGSIESFDRPFEFSMQRFLTTRVTTKFFQRTFFISRSPTDEIAGRQWNWSWWWTDLNRVLLNLFRSILWRRTGTR